MQQARNLELVNRTNYTPDKTEKHLVHYKAELPRHNAKTGAKESHPEIIKTGLKMFPSVKRDLEKQGYVIEIIYHPEGKYNTPIQEPKVDARDLEIAALKQQIAEMQAAKAEAEQEPAPKVEQPKASKPKKTTKK